MEKYWKDKFYQRINKYEMYDEIKKSVEQDAPTEKFQELVYSIAHKISKTPRFIKYTDDWIEDIRSGAAIKSIEKYPKYNLEMKESAYSFFYSVVKNAMIDVINKDFLKYFQMKKDLMKIAACEDGYNDLYYDDHPNNTGDDKVEYVNGVAVNVDAAEYVISQIEGEKE